jgi:Mg2+ and Co2+ transporter CorA
MRIFHITSERFEELTDLPDELPPTGFIWVGSARAQFESQVATLQQRLQGWTGAGLVDLHLSDLLNPQLPSNFEDTSWYDLLVFRRLSAGAGGKDALTDEAPYTLAAAHKALAAIDTSPVGFAVFDRVLLTVHPTDCQVREHFAQRLAQHAKESDIRGSARLPASPAELMLRMVNNMVDSYLELRRLLTRHFSTLQSALLAAGSRFHDWQLILLSRDALHIDRKSVV